MGWEYLPEVQVMVAFSLLLSLCFLALLIFYFFISSLTILLDKSSLTSLKLIQPCRACPAKHTLLMVEELVFASECEGGGLCMVKSFPMLDTW